MTQLVCHLARKLHFPVAFNDQAGRVYSAMMAVCPKCDIALVLLEFNDVEVDFCPRCEGLWLDSGEIEQIMLRTGGRQGDYLRDFIRQHSRRETGRPDYLCPRCDRPLKEVVRPSDRHQELRLDRCPRGDGIWFDKNELQLLLKSLPDEMEAQGAIALLSQVLGDYTEEEQHEGDLKE